MQNLILTLLICILFLSCNNIKKTENKKNDDVELTYVKRVESIETLKSNIFNQPDSVYRSQQFSTYINDFVDSLFRSSCYGQSFTTNEGEIVVKNKLSIDSDNSMYFNYDDTSLSSVTYNKFNKLVHNNQDLKLIQEKTDEIYTGMNFEEGGWEEEYTRIIPIKFKFDSTILNLVKEDKSLPFYFKESLFKNIPIFFLLRSKRSNYKGNSFEDGGLSKDQVGKTYHYGNYNGVGKVVSISFMYLEPKKDDNTTKYISSCSRRNNFTYEYDSTGNLVKKKITNGWFGYYEIGRIDQGTTLGSLRVLRNQYKFVEQVPYDVDINYSSGYFDYSNGSDDISVKLINYITNIPLDKTYEDILNFNGGYLRVIDKELNNTYLTLFYSSKSIPFND